MKHRTFALATALIVVAGLASLTSVDAVNIPPLPGQVRVVALVDASGCSGHSIIQYGLKSSDTAVGFKAVRLANCTTVLSMHEFGDSFSYVGGVVVNANFWSFATYEELNKDNHQATLTASWPLVNPNAPCPGQKTAAASTLVDQPSWFTWDDVQRPPTIEWEQPAISDGICTVTSNTEWTPYRVHNLESNFPPAYNTRVAISSTGVAECETYRINVENYYGDSARVWDNECILSAGEVQDPTSWVELAYIQPGTEVTINVPGHR